MMVSTMVIDDLLVIVFNDFVLIHVIYTLLLYILLLLHNYDYVLPLGHCHSYFSIIT